MKKVERRPPRKEKASAVDAPAGCGVKTEKATVKVIQTRLKSLGYYAGPVNGRKEVEWHKRIRLNIWYIDHCTFLLDVKIFFMTIFKVLSNADNENKGKTVQEQKIGEQGHAS